MTQKQSISFHIINENFLIHSDGIIGRDFFTKFLCKIDYESFTITLTLKEEEITLPMKSCINRNYCFKIEKRSEIIHPVDIDINEESIIINNEIQPGIF